MTRLGDFEIFWQQIFFKNKPKCFVTFGAILKNEIFQFITSVD